MAMIGCLLCQTVLSMDTRNNGPKLEHQNLAMARCKDALINDACIKPYIHHIFEVVAVPEPHFQTLYLSTIANFLALTQHCPRQDVVTRLQTITDGLKLRRSLILPLGASPEIASDQSDVWTYAVFVSLLLYNVAPDILGYDVMVKTQHSHRYKKWHALTEPLEPPLHFKVVGALPTSHYASAALIPIVINDQGLHWLGDDHSILNTLVDLIISPNPSNPLGALIHQVNGLETATTNEPVTPVAHPPITTDQPKSAPANKPHNNTGRQFRQWLMAEIGDTKENRNIVATASGVYLIDPDIFIQYAKKQSCESWETVKAEFLKLNLHAQQPPNKNNPHKVQVPGIGKRDCILMASMTKQTQR
jgi:Putative helicase/Putative conjugal transfer nickase/helicase TraI C-term